MNTTGFVPQANRITVGDVYGRKVIVGNQNSVRPDEIYAEVDEHTNLTKVVDANRTLVPGGGGTSDYADLENKPKINGTELNGDLSAEDLGLQDSINVNQGGTTSSTPELSDININGTQYAISKPYINETIPQFSFTAKLNTIRIPGNSVYYTVPAISTNITTDYNSDSKTASPKSVKEFVEGKGYYIKPQDGIPANDLASGVIPQPEVFWVEYGVTTLQQIKDANDEGKLVCCKHGQADFILSNLQSSYCYFSSINRNTVTYLLYNGSSWSAGSIGLQITADRVSSWQTTPDNAHYPSEKLVKDYVDGICGNIQTILTSI